MLGTLYVVISSSKEEDYQKVKNMYPFIEAELLRCL